MKTLRNDFFCLISVSFLLNFSSSITRDELCSFREKNGEILTWKCLREGIITSFFLNNTIKENNTKNQCCKQIEKQKNLFFNQFNFSIHHFFDEKAIVFEQISNQLDQSVIKLITETKMNLHNHLVMVYGHLYQSSSNSLAHLFFKLEQFYLGRNSVNLKKTFSSFFDKLTFKFFQLYYSDFLNPNQKKHQQELACVSNYTHQLPFVLSLQNSLLFKIRRPLIVLRLFSQSLKTSGFLFRHHFKLMLVNQVLKNDKYKNELFFCFLCPKKKFSTNSSSSLVTPPSCCSHSVNLHLSFQDSLLPFISLNNIWNHFIETLEDTCRCFSSSSSCSINGLVHLIDKQLASLIHKFKNNFSLYYHQIALLCGIIDKNSDRKQKGIFKRNVLTSSFPTSFVSSSLSNSLNDFKKTIEAIKESLSKHKQFLLQISSSLCQILVSNSASSSSCSLILLKNYSKFLNFSFPPHFSSDGFFSSSPSPIFSFSSSPFNFSHIPTSSSNLIDLNLENNINDHFLEMSNNKIDMNKNNGAVEKKDTEEKQMIRKLDKSEKGLALLQSLLRNSLSRLQQLNSTANDENIKEYEGSGSGEGEYHDDEEEEKNQNDYDENLYQYNDSGEQEDEYGYEEEEEREREKDDEDDETFEFYDDNDYDDELEYEDEKIKEDEEGSQKQQEAIYDVTSDFYEDNRFYPLNQSKKEFLAHKKIKNKNSETSKSQNYFSLSSSLFLILFFLSFFCFL